MSAENKRLSGRIAFITGGAASIGFGIAQGFVAEGAKVVLFDRDAEQLENAKSELKDDCLTVTGDVTSEQDVENALKAGLKHFGGIDIVVNNAAAGAYAHIAEHTEALWDTILDVGLKGVFLVTKHASRIMLANETQGVFINIASLNSRQPAEGMAAYCCAKAGVEMFTKVSAMELGPYGIRACAISPGGVDSNSKMRQTLDSAKGEKPRPGFGQEIRENKPLSVRTGVEDIAASAIFLASDDARSITAETLFVDAGCQTKRYPLMSKFMPQLEALTTNPDNYRDK